MKTKKSGKGTGGGRGTHQPLAREHIDAIAEALTGHRDRSDSAYGLISAVIGYVLTAPPDGTDAVRARTLNEVRRLLTLPDGPPLKEMAKSRALRGTVAKKAARIETAGHKKNSGILSAAIEQTAWIDTIQEVLR